jgi:5S rRNA maturation endonuclease (ribonuclease M5)
MGFNSIAPTSETSMIDNEIIDNLKQYFTLIVLYDLDMTGIKSSIKQMIKYNCHLCILPILENNTLKSNQYKDIAEYSQHLGLLKLYDIIETNTIQYKYIN